MKISNLSKILRNNKPPGSISCSSKWFTISLQRLLCEKVPVPAGTTVKEISALMFHFGEIAEITRFGDVTARLWAVPSGIESLSNIKEELAMFACPSVGDSVRAWTWLDLASGQTRRTVRVIRVWTADERRCLEEMLEKLEAEVAL